MFINKHVSLASKALGQQKIALKTHQKDALVWMTKKEKNQAPYGGIIADEMGLGKTLEVISLILGKPREKTLIIVPANLIHQWVSEFQKFAPHIDIGSEITSDVVISSYVKAARNQLFFEIRWSRLFLDEAHYIRNSKGKTYQRLSKINAKHKWCLTGTPLQNYIKDVSNLLLFIGFPVIDDLEEACQTHILRRTKESVNLKLPSMSEENIVLNLTTKEKKSYKKVGSQIHDSCHLESLLRLRQFTIMPQMSIDSLRKKSGKRLVVCSHLNTKINTMVKSLVESSSNEKPIVFCHFKKEIKYLQNSLTKMGLESQIIDGSVSMIDRQKIISSHEDYHALIIQLQAGSTGLNLQMFDTVYFTSPHWNPTHEQQAIARVHRIGQKKNIKVKRFIIDNTIESHIMNIQENKKELVEKLFP